MLNFGILLKSYDKDFDLAERLIESFNRFNPEQLQMFIVVPESDLPKFQIFESDTISVLSESLLGQNLVDHEVAGIRPGYINQEIVKLSFWELGLTANYFCVDSDALFIRPLSIDDFMFDESTPYTVLVEDNDLKSEPHYYEQHWKGREPQLRKIQEFVGIKDRRILTCHGHQVFSARVLESLKFELMENRNWTYEGLLAESPYEFSWYNMWLQVRFPDRIRFREPIVKTIHNYSQLIELRVKGISLTDLSRAYIGIVVNSNFQVDAEAISIKESMARTLSRYIGFRELLAAIFLRIWKKLRSRR